MRGIEGTLGFTINFSRSANAFSFSSNAFSRASNSTFLCASCCSAVESCFWHEQASAKGISNDRANFLFIINGELDLAWRWAKKSERFFDVKRKLTLLRRRRRCRFNCDHFDGVTPRLLDIGENCQDRQTNHNHCHQQNRGF